MGAFFMLNRFESLLAVLVLLEEEEALESSFVRGVCAAILADLRLSLAMRCQLLSSCVSKKSDLLGDAR
jgi:hypothetical protein